MVDFLLLIGSVLWSASLLFLVFSVGVAILSFSLIYFFAAVISFGAMSGFMVAVSAMKD